METFDIKEKMEKLFEEKENTQIVRIKGSDGLMYLPTEQEIIREFERLQKENEFLIETNKGLNEADNNKAKTILELTSRLAKAEKNIEIKNNWDYQQQFD